MKFTIIFYTVRRSTVINCQSKLVIFRHNKRQGSIILNYVSKLTNITVYITDIFKFSDLKLNLLAINYLTVVKRESKINTIK